MQITIAYFLAAVSVGPAWNAIVCPAFPFTLNGRHYIRGPGIDDCIAIKI